MVTQQVEVKHTIDEERAVATITAAFADDPVVRWIYPDPEQYATFWPRFVVPFGGGAFRHGSADTADDFAGVALWLPPGVAPEEEPIVKLLEESVADAQKKDAYGFIEQQSELHPHEPHWYLPLIGVDPAHQGRGIGSALLRHALQRADRDGLPAYLEATTERNKALYERHGFEVVGVIQYGASPPMWPMWRKPAR